MTDYPRVSTILREMVLFDQDDSYLLPRYLRRGRLVDWAAGQIVMDKPIPDSWWSESSGSTDPKDNDLVQHEEVRPYLVGVRKFLAEHRATVLDTQMPVVNHALKYKGTPDWLGYEEPRVYYVWDLKCGEPPTQWTPDIRINPLWVAYRRQTALYFLAAKSMGSAVVKRAGLHLLPNGDYRLVPHDDRSDLAASTAMVHAYHDRMRFKR